MTYFAILLLSLSLSLLLGFVFFQRHLMRKARKLEGLEAPQLEPAISEKLRERGKVLLYFYSPNCAPCKAMSPLIDRAAARHDNIFKFDARESLDLARSLGVMGTPTTVLIAGGRIAKIQPGFVAEKALDELLA